MKDLWYNVDFVALHQTQPDGYTNINGYLFSPHLKIGNITLPDIQYQSCPGYGDNGVYSSSDTDYLEFAVTSVQFAEPSDRMTTITREGYGGGYPNIGTYSYTQYSWHVISVPDNFSIPAPPPEPILFTTKANSVDFNHLTSDNIKAILAGVNKYDGLGGSDNIILPSLASESQYLDNSTRLGWQDSISSKFSTSSRLGDTYSVTGSDGDYYIKCGAGIDIVNITNSTPNRISHNTIDGGTGQAKITISGCNGDNVVTAGSGAITLNIDGYGNNTVQVQGASPPTISGAIVTRQSTEFASDGSFTFKFLLDAEDTFKGSLSGDGEFRVFGGTLNMFGGHNFTGDTFIQQATLVISSADAVGTGTIELADDISGAALQINGLAMPANIIKGFKPQPSTTIDLRSLAFSGIGKGSATIGEGNILQIKSEISIKSSPVYILHLDPNYDYSNLHFSLKSDGHGGTQIGFGDPPSAPTPPVLSPESDTGVSETDGVTSDTTPTLTGRAEAGTVVTLYDTDAFTVLGRTTANADGSYKITSTALQAGSHTLRVRSANEAGNSALSAGHAITIDTLAPQTPVAPTPMSSSDTGASSIDGITKSTTPIFAGVTSPGSKISLYEGVMVIGTATADVSSGAYSITSSVLSDGSHKLTMKVIDLAGNTSATSAAKTVVVDTKAPVTPVAPTLVATSDTGRSTADAITSDETPSLTGKAEAGATVTLYDGATAIGTALAASTGVYTITPASALADGPHTLTVTATDKAGNVSAASAGKTVTIDTTKPGTPMAPTLAAASDTGASSTDGITADTTPTIIGTAEAGATVTLYDNAKTKVGSVVADGSGAYAITSTALAAGVHNLTVTATDAAGNVGAASTALQVTIATKAPAAPAAPILAAGSDSGASASDGITSATTPTLTGKVGAGQTVTLYDGTKSVGTSVADATTGVYSVTASTLGTGSHSLTVKVTDAVGNVSAASAAKVVVVDTTAPVAPAAPTLVATSDTGRSTADAITSDETPSLTGKAEAGATVTLYDGATAIGTALAASTGVYTITPASALADGPHTLTVTATDKAGNVSAASAGKTVTIDTTKPGTPMAPTLAAASDTGASSTDGITADTTPTIIGTAEAGATVTLYDNAKTKVGSVVADGSGAYAITSTALAAGVHNLTVTATDAAGNVGAASTALQVTIATKAPAAPAAPILAAGSDSGASASDGITSATTPTLTGKVGAGQTVTLYDGTKSVGTSVADATTGVYSVTASTLGTGSHSLTVKVTDAVGNVSAASAAKVVVVDTTAPVAPVAPTLVATSDTGRSTADAITSDATPSLTGKAEAGATVTLYDGATAIGTALAASTGVYTITPASALADGPHTLTVTATDKAGNVSAASAGKTVTIDTTKPGTPMAPTLAAASDTGASSTDGITADTTPTIIGTAEAGATVTLYDNAKTVLGSFVADGSGAYAITSTALAAGIHSLTVTATDAAGNVGAASAALSMKVDATAPVTPTLVLDTASDTGASSTDGITNDATPTLTGKTEAGATVTLYDGTTAIGSTVAGTTGSYAITLEASLADGTHKLTAKATDVAGNVSAASAAKTLVVDTTIPAVVITSPVTDGTGAKTISGTGEAGATVTLTDHGSKVGAAVAIATNGMWSEKITFATPGAHDLVATAVDKAGNAGTSAKTMASMHSMIQAMSMMTPASSAMLTSATTTTQQEAHPLAAAH